MAQEQKEETPTLGYIGYIQKLNKTAVSIVNGDLKWSTEKKDLILSMKDDYIEMAKLGFYDKPKSEICADICEILKHHNADENAFAYVRMCLPSEYKDQTKVTFDSIIKRAFKQSKEGLDKAKINLLESFKKEDFEGLTPEERLLFKNEFTDVIKESKRRIRDNRQLVNIVCEDIEINQALVTDKKFPDMNATVKSILLELRDVIKNAKKINRIINIEADKTIATENRNFDYNEELGAIFEQTQRLNGMTTNLISLLGKL